MSKNQHKRKNTNYHPPVINGRMKQHMVRMANRLANYLKRRWIPDLIDMSSNDWSNRHKKRKRKVWETR